MNNDISNVTNVSFSPLAREAKNTQKPESNILKSAEDYQLKKTTEQGADNKQSPAKVTSLDEARKLVEEGNKILENVQRNLQFKVDDSTKRVVMSIVDKQTGETIRQVPTEDVLALAKRMQESDGKSGSIEGYIA
ncbi:flagellar protein FlaG [uncultured Paraglaciecola sp.]|uniref:flagellar protein FlaG n=1 Tax=uncultured Paraglaciecola sp. TaxID=1765024 RepID=UPI0025F61A8C|nr:flagellar protein FlaG [uncultured Paraglaciecola sp.]